MMPTIRSATQADEGATIAAIVVAFAADPVARWTLSEPTQYLAHFPDFVKAFGGRAFAHGSAYVADDFSGTALWLPPGVGPDEEARGGCRYRTTMQADAFTPSHPHAHLQPLEAVEPMQTVASNPPAFAAQQDVDMLIAKPRPAVGELADAHAQRRLILRLRAVVERRSPQQRQPTRTLLADLEPIVDPQRNLASSCRPQVFFITSCRMCRSSVRSATRRLSRAFSSASCLSWRNSVTPRLPYFFFQT